MTRQLLRMSESPPCSLIIRTDSTIEKLKTTIERLRNEKHPYRSGAETGTQEQEMSRSDNHERDRDLDWSDSSDWSARLPSQLGGRVTKALIISYQISAMLATFKVSLRMIWRTLLAKYHSLRNPIDPDDPFFTFEDDLDGVDELPESARTDTRVEDDIVDEWDGSGVAAVRSVAELSQRNGARDE